jgi:CRP-like cAMP-binding protein
MVPRMAGDGLTPLAASSAAHSDDEDICLATDGDLEAIMAAMGLDVSAAAAAAAAAEENIDADTSYHGLDLPGESSLSSEGRGATALVGLAAAEAEAWRARSQQQDHAPVSARGGGGASLNLPEAELLRRRQWLLDVPLFAGLTPAFADAVAQIFKPLTVKRKTVVIAKGSAGEQEMYFVAKGEVEIKEQLDLPPFASLGPGKFFGESSLLEAGATRNAFVFAQRTALLYVLRKEELAPLLAQFPEAEAQVAAALARQMAMRATERAGNANELEHSFGHREAAAAIQPGEMAVTGVGADAERSVEVEADRKAADVVTLVPDAAACVEAPMAPQPQPQPQPERRDLLHQLFTQVLVAASPPPRKPEQELEEWACDWDCGFCSPDCDAVVAHEHVCQVRLRAADPLHAEFVECLLVAVPPPATQTKKCAPIEGVPPRSHRWLCMAPST